MTVSDPIVVAAEIVAAFISYNSVPVSEVPNLIESVHAAVSVAAGLGQGSPADVDLREPAVSIRKSVTPDYLICLDDGRRYKSLRRHLTLLGMTPEQYRAKWNLPSHYPMVAASYSARRSAMAKEFGLGRSAGAVVKGKRGRPPKTAIA